MKLHIPDINTQLHYYYRYSQQEPLYLSYSVDPMFDLINFQLGPHFVIFQMVRGRLPVPRLPRNFNP